MPSLKQSGDSEFIAPIVAITKYMLVGYGTGNFEKSFTEKFGGKMGDE